MGFFHRKARPSSSMPSASSSAGPGTKPPQDPEAVAPSHDLDSEEARVLFSNLSIHNQIPESQPPPSGPAPSQPSSSYLQVPIGPSYPHFPSSPNPPLPPNFPSSPNFPSHPNFPLHPVPPEANFPSHPNFPSPPNFPSYPNFPPSPNFPSYTNVHPYPNVNFESSTIGSQSGTTPPPGSYATFSEYQWPNPISSNTRSDINSFNVTNVVTRNSHNNNSVTYFNDSSPSPSQEDDEDHGVYHSAQSGGPSQTEPVPRGRMELNINLGASGSFSHPFSSQQHQASAQTSLQASIEAQQLLHQQQQQMMQQAAETRRYAEETVAQALRQAELAQAEAKRMAEQLDAQAAEARRQANMASAQAATLRHESLEQRLAAAEVRRGEAEVRRREAEQRRHATERRLEALFGTRPATGTTPSSDPESSTCSGYAEHEVRDSSKQGTVKRVSPCEHDTCGTGTREGSSTSSQRVCMGYVEQEVMDEQGNPKLVSRLCEHEQCHNLYHK